MSMPPASRSSRDLCTEIYGNMQQALQMGNATDEPNLKAQLVAATLVDAIARFNRMDATIAGSGGLELLLKQILQKTGASHG